MSEWWAYLSEYGPPGDPVGFVEARNLGEAMEKAWPVYGHLCTDNRYIFVIGHDEPPPRPTVWSRLRNWEI